MSLNGIDRFRPGQPRRPPTTEWIPAPELPRSYWATRVSIILLVFGLGVWAAIS